MKRCKTLAVTIKWFDQPDSPPEHVLIGIDCGFSAEKQVLNVNDDQIFFYADGDMTPAEVLLAFSESNSAEDWYIPPVTQIPMVISPTPEECADIKEWVRTCRERNLERYAAQVASLAAKFEVAKAARVARDAKKEKP